jgi:hypothetical protein
MSTADLQLYVEGSAVVAEFPAEMPNDEEAFAEASERFQQLAAQSEVDTHVSVLRMDSAMGSDLFEKTKEAARAGAQLGIDRWIVVSEDLKDIAIRSKIGEIDGLSVETADDLDAAMAMVEE